MQSFTNQFIRFPIVFLFCCFFNCTSVSSVCGNSVPEYRFSKLKGGVNFGRYNNLKNRNLQVGLKELQRDIDVLKTIGLRHVRFPLVPSDFWNGKDNSGVNQKMNFLIQAIAKCKANKIAVIADMHGGDKFNHKLKNEDTLNRFCKFWTLFASILANRFGPDDLFFEGLNEPVMRYKDGWQKKQEKILKAIRKGAPKHTILVCGDFYTGIDSLLALKPYKDTNVVYNFHYYTPFLFSHQGASWITPQHGKLKKVPYPNISLNKIPAADQDSYYYLDKNGKKISMRVKSNPDTIKANFYRQFKTNSKFDETAREYLDKFFNKKWYRKTIYDDIKRAADWGKRYDVRLVCTEYGVFRWGSDPDDRFRWIMDVTSGMNKYNIGHTMWSYAEGFGFIDFGPKGERYDKKFIWGAIQIPH